jgi:hypothetical protein
MAVRRLQKLLIVACYLKRRMQSGKLGFQKIVAKSVKYAYLQYKCTQFDTSSYIPSSCLTKPGGCVDIHDLLKVNNNCANTSFFTNAFSIFTNNRCLQISLTALKIPPGASQGRLQAKHKMHPGTSTGSYFTSHAAQKMRLKKSNSQSCRQRIAKWRLCAHCCQYTCIRQDWQDSA